MRTELNQGKDTKSISTWTARSFGTNEAPIVLLAAYLLADPAGLAPWAEHTLAHEAPHIAIRERGEDLSKDPMSADAIMSSIAVQTVEEFRVERALHEQGLPFAEPLTTLVTETPEKIRTRLNAELEPVAYRENEQHALSSALSALVALAHHVGHVVGADVGDRHSLDLTTCWAGWTRLDARWYALIRAVLVDVPGGQNRADLAALREAGDALTPILRAWFTDVGTAVGEDGDLPQVGALRTAF